ncbi:MAG: hypothetical protein RIC16_00710 [Rhodospirillales bacterium]
MRFGLIVAMVLCSALWPGTAHTQSAADFAFDGSVWRSVLSGQGPKGEITITISGDTFEGIANDPDPDSLAYSPYRCSGKFIAEDQTLDGFCRAHGYFGYGFSVKGRLGEPFESGRYSFDLHNDAYAMALPEPTTMEQPGPPEEEAPTEPVETTADEATTASTSPDVDPDGAATIVERLQVVRRLLEQNLISESEAARTRKTILSDL